MPDTVNFQYDAQYNEMRLLEAAASIPAVGKIASGIQWIAHVKKIGQERKINEVWRIEGREGDTILMRPVIV